MRRIIREEEPPRPSTRLSTLGQAGCRRCRPTAAASRGSCRPLFRGELDWIVMKALEKDRNRRYETASAFAADVRAVPGRRAGAGVPAVGVVPLPQVRPAEQGGAVATATAAALVVLRRWRAWRRALPDRARALETREARQGETGQDDLKRTNERERVEAYFHRIALAHARTVREQPGPGPEAPRRVSGGPARVGVALPHAALPGGAGRPPGQDARSTASRSAPTASAWPPRAGTGPSGSGTARRAR